jgi:hypothetical protein
VIIPDKSEILAAFDARMESLYAELQEQFLDYPTGDIDPITERVLRAQQSALGDTVADWLTQRTNDENDGHLARVPSLVCGHAECVVGLECRRVPHE